ncbi:MinD/ParA family protein [Aneurinibacillus terranovensis]|uniref:MinD/ParA family protein n=1 Tax=Aneurinibacillus terranovensis TaxID=278991 RepID=UPI0003FE98C1|nr:MinD/ParA family protein [Aneurinibacillus terranovensis]
MNDQAQSLREKFHKGTDHSLSSKKTKVITVTSGKGGVGKSNFSLNFALGLIERGQKVVVIDLDVGFANIDVLMGISSQKNITQMIDNNLTIWDIIELGPKGLEFIAGGTGLSHMIEFNEQKLNYFFEQLALLNGYADTIILDTGAGISKETLRFILSADEVILVTTPEPTSITDAYAVVKMTQSHKPNIRFNVVVNRAASYKEGKSTGAKLALVAKQFLGLELVSLGCVYDDVHVSKAVRKQEPFFLSYPTSKAAESIRSLVSSYLSRKTQQGDDIGIKGFISRLRQLWKS